MDLPTNFEQALNQVSEMQRQLFKGFTAALPSWQTSDTQKMHESFDKALKFQEKVVASSLEIQTLSARLAIESQKQLWQNYFNMLQNK